MSIGTNVRLAREHAGLTQIKLAEKLNISPRALQNYESDKRSMDIDLLVRLSEACNTSLDFFVTKSMSLSTKKDVTKSSLSVTKSQPSNYYDIKILSHVASAGTSADIDGIEVHDTYETMPIAHALFKTQHKQEMLRAVQIDGNSMYPMLSSGDWVIFELCSHYKGDGVYILNCRNILMAKLLQLTPKGSLKIISVNKDFESWEIDEHDQSVFQIYGKSVKFVI